MELHITKNIDKPHTLLYRRDNGTETWMAANEYFVRHDLGHYALENSLGYTRAFMGMLNGGMELNDFTDSAKRKATPLSDEAVYAENMTNLFLMELMQGRLDDFNAELSSAFNPMGTDARPIELSAGQLTAVLSLFGQLLDKWLNLQPGQTMTLEF